LNALPTLYKRTSTGALQEWTVYYDVTGYWARFGQTGGTIQQSEQTVCCGKNIGRANATTQAQQAELEAKALWEKKLKRGGYNESRDAAGQDSDLIAGGLWPMLALHYKDCTHRLTWPCYGQRKYNGHRCIARIDADGEVTLWSRKRIQIHSVPHIVAALKKLGWRSVDLDGELFDFAIVAKHGLEGLSHLVKQRVPIEGHEEVKYHVYDAPVPDIMQTDRFRYLDRYLGVTPELPLVRAETRVLANLDAAMAFLEEAIDEGQEGIMLRDMAGMYRGHATTHVAELLKLKGRDGKCDDAEFTVTGLKEGVGKMAGCAIFICETQDGKSFDAKMKGKGITAKLQDYWQHPEKIVGRKLTVEFNGWTEKGIPWFPRALQPREDL